jgi:hypothetical protein
MTSEDYERAAAGQDFDDAAHDRASDVGSRLASDPNQILDAVEELLPESWREQIRQFPIAAILLGIGVGIYLGFRKSDELLAAGSALVTSAVTTNLNSVLAGRDE